MRNAKNILCNNYRFTVLLLCLSTIVVKAQDAQIFFQTSLALPFNESITSDSRLESDLSAFGFGGGFMFQFPINSPLKIGASFRYMLMGGKSRNFDLVDINGRGYNLESAIKGSMSPLHLMLRLDPMPFTTSHVMPYIGGFSGFRFFEAKQRLIIDYQDGSEPNEENIREVSVTSSYGFEIGLHIRFYKGILIDFRYEHAYGGWAKYLDFSSIEIDAVGNATYERLESRTNVSMYTIGLVLNLGELDFR